MSTPTTTWRPLLRRRIKNLLPPISFAAITIALVGVFVAMVVTLAVWSDRHDQRKCDDNQRKIAAGTANYDPALAAEGFAGVAKWCSR